MFSVKPNFVCKGYWNIASLPPFTDRRHRIVGVSAEIRTLTSRIQIGLYVWTWPVFSLRLFLFSHVFHNRKRRFCYCLSSQAKHPVTLWRLYCLRLQVERQKGEPTLMSQLERANRNLYVAFSIPNNNGSRSNFRNGVGFSARDDGHSRQSPVFFMTVTICIILWSRKKLLVKCGLLSTALWRRIVRWTFSYSEVYCSNY